MGRGKIGLIRFWGLVLLTLLYLTHQAMSTKDRSKTCTPSHCGIIANISYPFRLRDDPANCGDHVYELACENNVTLLHLYSGIYQVMGINYNNYTVRLKDPGIREGDCSSLPRYFLSRSNFTDSYNFSYDYDSNHPYLVAVEPSNDSKLTFDHVIYLHCSDPVRDDPLYADTAPCVGRESRRAGEGGGHVYAVVGDLGAGRLKPECRVKSVATITSDWSSFLKGESFSYADIHRVFSYGFEISWWKKACSDLPCPANEYCLFDNNEQKVLCTKSEYYCYRFNELPFPLFCGKAAHLSYRVQAYLVGILAGLPFFKDIHWIADSVYSTIESQAEHNGGSNFNSTHVAFDLGKITGRYVLPFTILIILRFLVGIFFLSILLIYTCRRRHLSGYENIEDFIRLHHNLHPLRYSYKDLKTMTKGFKNKIGEGGFGTVYKGKLRSGSEVAIKMLGKSKATGQEFISEVATIGRIHHFNVVHLVGFCVEGMKRALIYEFMSKGSLDKYIFAKKGSVSLSYRKVYEISLGVARGIAYLHHGCDMKILHFDIKPHNILLDDNFTPKISDFGLARLYSIEDSIVTLTAARGTIGYMAPELFYKNIGGVSYKADVYSFGMLLMEMANRRRNLNQDAEHSSQVYFPLWIYDQFDEEKDIEMEDLTEEEKNLAKKMFIVALWCIQLKPTDRPSMNKVIEMLEATDVESFEMPPKPSLYPNERVLMDSTSNFSETTSIISTQSHSSLGECANDGQ
ncbi:LEAF RUST 10 DISEASE-RESISTANCE LOCUS RECEPTOR-LIKE PROTEIN KINASE-like 2.7 [Prosopis cineraria]|uniref:LEAF RUST 10 DISEASE-RESISTANCE LOCUS RECEPTOR-LIKE PROTEIN KINASE-like 2.7 n=1 Tax=Prosopis cineraria TaxID=364024 RepID=UPI00241051A1|nr:LEAF RUST 10 DISEASE-RESISTANCE LOCUS RECEPTOR-LIKE PROTEIN KINASE-like 2.7 [Prosopis cineraria]